MEKITQSFWVSTRSLDVVVMRFRIAVGVHEVMLGVVARSIGGANHVTRSDHVFDSTIRR